MVHSDRVAVNWVYQKFTVRSIQQVKTLHPKKATAKALALAADASLSEGFTYASVESNDRCPRCCRMRKAFAPARTMSIAAVCFSTCGCCRDSGRPTSRAIVRKSLYTV